MEEAILLVETGLNFLDIRKESLSLVEKIMIYKGIKAVSMYGGTFKH